MTASAGIAIAPSEELAAAVRGDLIMPGDPGHDDAPPQAGQPEPGRRRWAVLAVVSAAQFLIILDLWVVNIALPALQHDFAPASLSGVSWILDVYAIVLAALLLPAGRAADGIGRRQCFLAGLSDRQFSLAARRVRKVRTLIPRGEFNAAAPRPAARWRGELGRAGWRSSPLLPRTQHA
jgi:hypothetical protein